MGVFEIQLNISPYMSKEQQKITEAFNYCRSHADRENIDATSVAKNIERALQKVPT